MPAFSFYHKSSVDCAKVKEFQYEDSSTNEKLLTNTLVQQVKPNVMDKEELNIGRYPNEKQTPAFSDHQDFDASIKIHYFPIEKFYSNREVSLQTFMEKFNPGDREKNEFESLDVNIRANSAGHEPEGKNIP